MTPEAEAAHREPRTEAGKRMLHDWQLRRTHPPTAARQESYRQFILAIEAEAAALAAEPIAASSRPEDEIAAWLRGFVPAAAAHLHDINGHINSPFNKPKNKDWTTGCEHGDCRNARRFAERLRATPEPEG